MTPNDKTAAQNSICIFCTTPYQIMTAITMAQSAKAEHKDIYITNQFSDCEEYIRRLKGMDVFDNVYYIDAQKLGLEVDLTSGRLLLFKEAAAFILYIKNLIFLKSTVKKYFDTSRRYRSIFVSSNAMAGRFAILYHRKYRLRTNICHFDDGIGSYCNIKGADDIPLYDKLCRFVFIGARAVHIPFAKYLYSPELFLSLDSAKTAAAAKYISAVKRIPPSKRTENDRALIKKLFNMESDFDIKQKFIFFDTVRSEEYNTEGCKFYAGIVRKIDEALGKNEMIYKYHPRDKYYDSTVPYIKNTTVPFEAYCYLNDFSDKVCISGFSTAVFTPKLLFDQEPIIILFYKLMTGYAFVSVDYSICDKLRDMYRDKRRVIVPETEEELINEIKKIKDGFYSS